MGIVVTPVTAGDAHRALADAVVTAKGGRALRPVTVVVPTNAAGVIARRALGRLVGVAAVDMVTIYRLAERLAGPALRSEDRLPVSTAVVDQAVRAVLRSISTGFDEVADHPSTVVALRDLHRELRLAGPAALQALAATSRGREAARVSQQTTLRLAPRWYDEGDLLERSIASVRAGGLPPELTEVIVFLPQWLSPLERQLVRALADGREVQVIVGLTGNEHADHDVTELAGDLSGTLVAGPPAQPPRADVEIVSVTDADEEVRHAVRVIVDAARAGTPLGRMAILWPAERPYARLVEHHLGVAGIPWNGRPGTRVAERLVPRFLMDLLDIDRRKLRRRDLFDLLADTGGRDADGRHLPVALWERVSRDAGVVNGDDWTPRLRSYAAHRRQRADEARAAAGDLDEAQVAELTGHHLALADAADALADYVIDLRRELGRPDAVRAWSEWVEWSVAQIERRLGLSTITDRGEPEHQAWEHTSRVLDRLRHLDGIAEPCSRSEFRATFAAEFDVAPGRLGRIGAGVTVGSLASAAGLAADLVVVLGAAEGVLPARPTADPLIGDAERRAAGLQTAAAAAARAHRHLLGVLDVAAKVVVLTPRGDLRSTADRQPSRWLAELGPAPVVTLDSHASALVTTPFPAHATEHRLRRRATAMFTGAGIDATGDPVLARSLALRAARRSDALTVYDGDLTGVRIDHFDRPIAPTRLETWASCPHSYFVQYVLGVRHVEEPEDHFRIAPHERGTLIHDVLDEFHREVIAGVLPQPAVAGWTDVHRQRLDELFDQLAERYERSGRTGRAASWAVERQRLVDELRSWMERDSEWARTRRASVLHSETKFGAAGEVELALPSGRRIAVLGTIDRIDRTPQGLIVTDHKSGKPDDYKELCAEQPTAGGTRFQLAAYAAAALGLAPDATAVRAEYAFFERGRFARVGYGFDDAVWARIGADLDHVVTGIESGWFPPTPEPPGYEHYVKCWYCTPDGLGSAERYPEWERKRHDPRLARWFAEPDADACADTEPGLVP